MKLASIVSTRPQFIKLGPLSKKLRLNFNTIIIHTGQHFDNNMSKMFFKDLDIPEPDYNLQVCCGNHGEQTGEMMIKLEKVIVQEYPSLIIVFGDTNSTLAGSLVSSKLNIPVLHIEAGLRSFNRSMPEEINRIVSDHISNYLFAPTINAVENLENEGLKNKAFLSGDIMVDSLADNIRLAKIKSQILEKYKLESGQYILLTLHRPYNVDNPEKLNKIFIKLSNLKHKIIFPIHPRTRKIVTANKFDIPTNIFLSNPLSYLDFITLESNCKKIITDSGGIQKEAYLLKKACITIRPETEWVETVKDGWNMLIDVDSDDFIDAIESFNPSHKQTDLFGKNVADKMLNKIIRITNSIS